MLNFNEVANLITKRVRNFRGGSLVEVLVSAGILAVLALVSAQMITAQNKATREITRTVEISELQRELKNLLDANGLCSCNFSAAATPQIASVLPPNTTVFNSTVASSTISLPYIIGTCTASDPAMITAGALVPNTRSGLRVATIAINNLRNTSLPSLFMGNLTVTFENTPGDRPRRPLVMSQLFNVNTTNPGAATILNCHGSSRVQGYTLNIAQMIGHYPQGLTPTTCQGIPNDWAPQGFYVLSLLCNRFCRDDCARNNAGAGGTNCISNNPALRVPQQFAGGMVAECNPANDTFSCTCVN